MHRCANSRKGLSRAELITIVMVTIVITGLLIPWILQRRGLSQRNFCELRQMIVSKGLFLRSVESPTFPGFREVQASLPDQRIVETSWVFPVLPYIHPLGTEIADRIKDSQVEQLRTMDEKEQLENSPYRQLYDDFGPDGNRAGNEIPEYVAELVCPESGKNPTEQSPQPMSFIVNCGMPDQQVKDAPLDHLANGVFFDRVATQPLMTLDYLSNNDGLENTLLLTENLDAGQTFDSQESLVGFVWIDSQQDGIADRDPEKLLGINQQVEGMTGYPLARPSGFHPGGVNVAFADGSTKFLSEQIDYIAYVHYMTVNGYEVKVAGTKEYAKDPYRLSK